MPPPAPRPDDRPAPTAAPEIGSEADPAARRLAGRLLDALGGLDLTSADGRAGINTLLSEIERLSPGAIHRQAAGMDLRRLGWSPRPAGRPAGPAY